MYSVVGQDYREFDGMRQWELLFEDTKIVVLAPTVERGRDCNLLGFDSSTLRGQRSWPLNSHNRGITMHWTGIAVSRFEIEH